MNVTKKLMKELEDRDYGDLEVPEHLVHFVKWRDRLAYYSLQLRPFFYQEPWDLPIEVEGRRYAPADLTTLQGRGMTPVEFHSLLTDIEVALIEAAARRGISLRKRGKVDDDGYKGARPQRQKRGGDWALGD
ncbi:hypothetical protein DSM110093_02347 [Sulfitobacter sp. DSM 110093]|uniref:hypothetical protein n=1 Tax=Sulfitobacter sp. DSM 110093 TaxID=2883127 RepID=UPI001FAC5A4C|nr:hypothetical protein [Sulfitobacter sp. DSM 110093]UOA32547.1 hypothetical protein DSM110093_02347 [Sulfitobacter sp. DSM 110093]